MYLHVSLETMIELCVHVCVWGGDGGGGGPFHCNLSKYLKQLYVYVSSRDMAVHTRIISTIRSTH